MEKHQSGLTVIELIFVLAIVAILATIGLPAMASFVSESRLTAKTNLTMAHLQFARQAAVTHRANVVACPSDDHTTCSGGNRWDQGWVIFIDRDNNRQADSPSDVLRVVAPEQDLLLHSAGRHRVRFQPSGAAYGTNLTIRVCDARSQAEARAIVVSNPGRVRVRRGLNAQECVV
ncbi:MAG: GspH/FimT family pseudopilin [Wenzhouxiangella sp.]|jgi:type IV fimbrial biogenesis protein FimT|nr:GspH/FimT family pseudopilin [Wenzhouxiangella sp.]